MAKSRKRRSNKENDNLVQVDIYYLPSEQAEMYKVLREAVASEVSQWLEGKFAKVDRLADPEEGESLVAYNEEGQEIARYYLSPSNISQAQVARDKDQLSKHLEKLLLNK